MLKSGIFLAAAVAVSFSESIFAQEDLSTKPQGYDESFQTGDIPKPKEPELDPDLASEEELNPDKSPDKNPLNDPARDYTPPAFRVGATAGLYLPHVFGFGLDSLIGQHFGVGVNYGKTTRSINSVDVGIKHTDVRLRWFPWGSSFFTGVALGTHELTGELNRSVQDPTSKQTVSVRGKLTASARYAAPHIGWFSVWDSGFTMGCDFGWLVPSGVSTSFTSSFGSLPSGVTAETLEATNEYKEMKKDLEDSAKKYASTPVPFATLIRIGWMF
jgi:hypothetical protein